ncbi:MAG: hypothetical protein Q9214_007589 [Letrouitia sp. 1 TL-2023]
MNTPEDDLFAKYANSAWFNQSYSKWESLRVAEYHILANLRFCNILSSGLPRFQKLESISFDSYLAWGSITSGDANFIQNSGTHPELFPEGSPLSRTWTMFYPQPFSVTDPSIHVKNVMRALFESKCFIKGLDFKAIANTGLPSSFFRHGGIDEGLGYQMASSLWKLESLTLEITPLEADRARDQQNSKALGFLPQLLSRMVRLNRLFLCNLMPEDDWFHFRDIQTQETNNRAISRAYYSYAQIFKPDAKWEHLSMLLIKGLAITAADLFFLISYQAPNLKRLWLSEIDLLQGSWDSVMVAFKGLREWDLFSFFGGLFRHQDGQWWPFGPPTWKNEADQHALLKKCAKYVESGRSHPSLPPEFPDDSAFYSGSNGTIRNNSRLFSDGHEIGGEKV